MPLAYVLHIVAGSLGLLSGYVALATTKGLPLHRRSGTVFVNVMLAMAASGCAMATVRGVAPSINVPAALITAYLVVTAFTTVRPPAPSGRWLAPALAVVAFVVGLTCLTFGIDAIRSPDGRRFGFPPFPYFLFGSVGTLGALLDVRMLRAGGLTGAARLTRHLWRMCFALFIASLSFYIGQAKVIPEPIRIYPLLAMPVLAVLLIMFSWIWRVRLRKSFRFGT